MPSFSSPSSTQRNPDISQGRKPDFAALLHDEKDIARIQLSGRNAAFPADRAHFDDRLLQKHLILERFKLPFGAG